MPQVLVLGELASAESFGKSNLQCKWTFVLDNDNWTVLEGAKSGVTQLCDSSLQEDAVWSHPIDVHFSTSSIQGWPKIKVEVWHEDKYGRQELCGYGMTYLPSSPGEHDIECVTWVPKSSTTESIAAFFLGTVPKLEHPSVVTSSENRFDLCTETSGIVNFRLNVLLRGLKAEGAVCCH